ncbi:HIT family protein [bacterium]|nr:MAG: HIT family protein [bacterium]
MKNCLFCKIIKGEIPSHKIYEDEKTLAFLDVNPVSRGHALVISKKHAKNLFDISKQDLIAVSMTIKKIAKILKNKLGAEGINILQANEEVAGQSVFHIHFHIVPRYQNDKLTLFPHKRYLKNDFKEILDVIKGP